MTYVHWVRALQQVMLKMSDVLLADQPLSIRRTFAQHVDTVAPLAH